MFSELFRLVDPFAEPLCEDTYIPNGVVVISHSQREQ
jgi:hypothetical protein